MAGTVCPSSILTLTNSLRVLGKHFRAYWDIAPTRFPDPDPPSTIHKSRPSFVSEKASCNQLKFKERQEQAEQFCVQGFEEPFDSCDFGGSGTNISKSSRSI
jgi:hypothetical protein